ncbi:peptidase [Plantactinospora sp. B24E8]|uniref:peptidase n=1 Tax=Plantactinospora sp. B24E8 TaxID=3153567 RepID=UPI00325F05A4
MHPATRQIRNRVGAGAAATLTALALTAVSPPAYAAEPEQPTLWVTGTVSPYIHESGVTIGLNLANQGKGAATDVTVRYNGDQLTDDVLVSLTDTAAGCQLTGKSVLCEHRDLAPGQVDLVEQIILTSRPDARPGTGGAMSVTLAGTGPDGTPASIMFPLDVEILPDPDLVVAAEDVGSDDDRVGAGDTRPLRAVVVNRGITEAQNVRVKATLPVGATFAERYEECVYEGDRPGTPPAGYVYDATSVTCVLPLTLQPGDGLVLADEETDEALFNATFGRNLPGPTRHSGSFEVDEDDQSPLPGARSRAAPDGSSSAPPADPAQTAPAQSTPAQPAPSRTAPDGQTSRLAERVTVLRAADARTTRAARDPWPDNVNDLKPAAEFTIWSKANTYDFAVAVPSLTGAVGDTVEVAYTITNRGPSDGSASWRIVAPSGTVLLPSEWCEFRDDQGRPATELSAVECGAKDDWPAEASGSGTVSATVRVKIKSEPGTNGTITVRPHGHSTETSTSNNTARIVINKPGGGGGELPITGARPGPTGALGASAVLLGVLLLLLVRRRRVASEE